MKQQTEPIEISFPGRRKLTGAAVLASVLFVSPLYALVRGQAPPATKLDSRETATPATRTEDTRYRIGAGDVLSILVSKSPELSMEAVRVDQRGMIRIPMIESEVLAACRTESELASQIATLYLEYKKNPSVQVFVRDFQSRPVAVIGAVTAPGQFRLQRQIRLLELLSLAGGPSERAGRIIDVIHTGGSLICENDVPRRIPEGEGQTLGVFPLTDTLKGREGSNPWIRPGDIISVPDADLIFVVGRVLAPRAIALKDKQITVSRAVAMAGGPQRDGNISKVRIVRQPTDGQAPRDIYIDLNAVNSHRAEDIALLPNDIVEVGSSTGKTILGILTGSISPLLSNGIVRAVP